LKRVLLAILVLLALIAVWYVARAWRVDAVSVVEPSTSRAYHVIEPRARSGRDPLPVLLVLHAHASQSTWTIRRFGLAAEAADRRGWLVVAPDGRVGADGNQFWNASAACCVLGADHPDDVAFLLAVLQDVGRRYPVDRQRVFAFGESNGGFMAHRLACQPGGPLAAIVSVAGAGQGPDDLPCSPNRPVSVLEVHGDADDIIDFRGGRRLSGRYPSTAETVAAWRAIDGLTGAPATETTRTWLVGRVRRDIWREATVSVAQWTVEGGGHNLRFLRRNVPEMLDFLEGR
jgi:polyhydroxybutyrate depolymerase